MYCHNNSVLLFPAIVLALVLAGCHSRGRTNVRLGRLPPVILWAWERPEDLEFLDAQRYGVAFLAQTLTLSGADVVITPRHQPLKVSPATQLIAVSRVESQKVTGTKATLTEAQKDRLVILIARTLELPNIIGIQVDFDAALSEREFYRKLLHALRLKIPDGIPLSMTALASFCVGDRWLDDLPVDEAVPMIFRMGTDEGRIKNLLASGTDFREPLCRTSYGIALDEPLEMKFINGRRFYVFNNRPWTLADVASLEERLRR